jgi:hypothetical protein
MELPRQFDDTEVLRFAHRIWEQKLRNTYVH